MFALFNSIIPRVISTKPIIEDFIVSKFCGQLKILHIKFEK